MRDPVVSKFLPAFWKIHTLDHAVSRQWMLGFAGRFLFATRPKV